MTSTSPVSAAAAAAASITARFTRPGLHHWPDAPPRRGYLAHDHRHLFHVEVRVAVAHSERAVEFHDLAEQAAAVFDTLGTRYHPDSTLVQFGPQSCETLARRLADGLGGSGLPVRSVTVSEDGENDSTWEPR